MDSNCYATTDALALCTDDESNRRTSPFTTKGPEEKSFISAYDEGRQTNIKQHYPDFSDAF